MDNRVKLFFHQLMFTPPLFMTPKGDAMVHLEALRENVVAVRWLASIHRGAGRAALTKIVEVADHAATLELVAPPQPSMGGGKKLTHSKLEAFYAGFGFVTTGRSDEGFAHMVRGLPGCSILGGQFFKDL